MQAHRSRWGLGIDVLALVVCLFSGRRARPFSQAMPAENDHPQGAAAGSSAPEAAESPSALAQGLPAVSPDLIEEIRADEIDNIVPTHGYHQLPVVALGGSAGSIQALKVFFQAPATDSGMAYVVILHLSPDHASTLPELLLGTNAMPVRAAQDAERLEADHVYVNTV